MFPPTLLVPRGTFDVTDPWRLPADAAPQRLVRAEDGAAPRLATTVAAYWDDEALTIVFAYEDDGVVATFTHHDEPLWQEDVVEAFLAPRALTEYFELEVNPLGATFDARIESPDGHRGTMKTFLEWTCEGLFAANRRGDQRTETVIRVPFSAVGGAPRAFQEWRANFFRIDRDAERGDEYSAWSATMKSPADFHVPAAFGTLRFA